MTNREIIAAIKDLYLKLNRTKSIAEGSVCKGCCYKELTLTEVLALKSSNKLVPNKTYKILNVHKNKVGLNVPILYDDGTNSGVDIYLKSLSSNEFSKEGWGEFWNPKYDRTNYGKLDIVSGITLYGSSDGTGYSNATNVPTTGGSGTGLTVDIVTSGGVITSCTLNNPGTGYINGDEVTITGGNADATRVLQAYDYLYNIYSAENPNVGSPLIAPGTKKIWGGYVWQSINGVYINGYETSATELNSSEWSKVAYNSDDYTKVLDYIEYDIDHDWISRRRYAPANVDVIFPYSYAQTQTNINQTTIHAISAIPWGLYYSPDDDYGITDVIVHNSYAELINFKGKHIEGLTLDRGAFWGKAYDDYYYFGKNVRIVSGLVSNRGSYTGGVFDTGGQFRDFNINNISWVGGIKVNTNSILRGLRVDNESGFRFGEFGFEIKNSSTVSNIVLDNYSEIQGFRLDNSSLSTAFIKNGSFAIFNCTDSAIQVVDLNKSTLTVDAINDSAINGMVVESSSVGYIIDNEHFFNIYHFLNTIEYQVPSSAMLLNGSAGHGAVGALVMVEDFPVPQGSYIDEINVVTSGLVYDPGAYITIGISGDDPDCGLNSTDGLLSNLAANPVFIPTPVLSRATTQRKLIFTVGGNTIYSGQISVKIKLNS